MIWPRVYRHVAADSLAALVSCEAQVFGGGSVEADYHVFGRLLLRADYLAASLASDLQARCDALVRLATGRSPAYWRTTQMLAPRLRLSSAAVAVLLKNNIRAFYPEGGVTLKVSNPHEPAGRLRIETEAANRLRVKSAGGVGVPPVVRRGSVTDASFLVESLLEGHRPLAAADVDDRFVRALVAFQEANRVAAPDTGADTLPRLDAGIALAGIALPPRLASFVERHRHGANAGEPWSLCHGDLGRSNILVKDEGFAIIDWEFGRAAPAALDAVRLSTQYRGFAEAYVGALGHPQARGWLVLGCLYAIDEHMARLDGLSANTHRARIAAKTAGKVAAFIALAETMCTGAASDPQFRHG
jgi:hypothetical protein